MTLSTKLSWPTADRDGWIVFEHHQFTVKVYPLNGDWEWEISLTATDEVLDSGADPEVSEAKRMAEIYIENNA